MPKRLKRAFLTIFCYNPNIIFFLLISNKSRHKTKNIYDSDTVLPVYLILTACFSTVLSSDKDFSVKSDESVIATADGPGNFESRAFNFLADSSSFVDGLFWVFCPNWREWVLLVAQLARLVAQSPWTVFSIDPQ